MKNSEWVRVWNRWNYFDQNQGKKELKSKVREEKCLESGRGDFVTSCSSPRPLPPSSSWKKIRLLSGRFHILTWHFFAAMTITTKTGSERKIMPSRHPRRWWECNYCGKGIQRDRVRASEVWSRVETTSSYLPANFDSNQPLQQFTNFPSTLKSPILPFIFHAWISSKSLSCFF